MKPSLGCSLYGFFLVTPNRLLEWLLSMNDMGICLPTTPDLLDGCFGCRIDLSQLLETCRISEITL